MLSHVLLSLMLASPPAPMTVETVRALDFGKMTYEEAKTLEGKGVRVSFVAGSTMYDKYGCTIFPHDDKRVVRSVHSRRGVGPCPLGRRMTVEGIIRTQIFPAGVIDGKPYPKSLAIQVEQARSVMP